MISLAYSFKIYVANSPVDFRKGMDGLAAIVVNEFDLDPFDGAIFVFRSKRADRLKIIVWDGTGLVLVHKRIEGKGFVWPRISEGTISISKRVRSVFPKLNSKLSLMGLTGKALQRERHSIRPQRTPKARARSGTYRFKSI